MPDLDKPTARIPVLGRDKWSTWKEKFKALLEYKILCVAIKNLDSLEGQKASDEARSLMIMHTEHRCDIQSYSILFGGQKYEYFIVFLKMRSKVR
jgi:hypothetical protein